VNGLLPGLLACLLVFPWPAPAAQCFKGTLVGEVTYVRDGDTIELRSMAIRFQGIAAPEWGEPGSAEATEAIEMLVLGKEVRCELTGKRTYDRCVAVCYLNGVDLEALMVRNGFARDCPRYSGGRHAEAERHAADEGAAIGRVYPLPGYCRPR
jgi:endonuclease YncB( thermonuclease family)